MTLPEDTNLENRYRIDRLLAHGGMGAIYRAYDTNLSTPVAIKENFFQTPHHIAQFKQEALILARLRHPALPRVIHHFSFEGQQYLVMDFIEGENLWEVVQRRGEPLEEREALDYSIQVCQAINYLHRQNPPIIHRDIKPQNIKITPEGRAMLVDFGIAKQVVDQDSPTETGAQGVTAGFSPPEQYGGGGGTNPTSDIYSLGATLYAVLTGKKPPISVSLMVGNVKFKSPDAINPKLSRQCALAIAHAMQVKPADRPQSVIEWQRTLESVIGTTVLTEQDKKPTLASVAQPKIDEAERPDDVQIKPVTGATSYWLVDSTGSGYALGPEPLAIGRHSASDVVVEDLDVSRNHARVRVDEGRCFVRDENSANGTFLNGRRLRPEWYPLDQGDVLVIGPARFYLTTTKPVKLSPPKRKMPPAAVGAPAPVPGPVDKGVVQPATEPISSTKSRLLLVITLAAIIVVLLSVAGYMWFNPGLLSGLTSAVADQTDLTPQAQAPSQTQTAEAIVAETAEAEAELTAQAESEAQATRQAEAARQAEETRQAENEATAQANIDATEAAIAENTPTTPPDTATPQPTTESQDTATPTPTLTPQPTATKRVAPVVAGPTLIPLKSTVTIDQIGSREVTDVDLNPQNPREVYALLKGDGIYKSSNGGDGPWDRVELDGEAITSVIVDPANPARIYASTWNAVLKSTDGGNTWEAKTNGLLANQVVDVVVIHPANSDILYAGIGETLVISTDQAENWSSLGYGEGLGLARLYYIVIDPFNHDIIYVGGLAGSIYKSDNNGRTFIQLRFNTGHGTFGLAAHPTQPNVYLAGINSFEGGIIKTENGADFHLVNNGLIFGGADSAYSAITYAPGNPNIVYAGSGYESDENAKGIFKSIDGGESWTRINKGLAVNGINGYPHYVKSIAIHPTNPNTLLAATGSGLYKSIDGGATWSLR
jgi:predicted Ser/Thr protein kinase